MAIYVIEGKKIKTEGPLSEEDIDEIGNSIRASATEQVAATEESPKDLETQAEEADSGFLRRAADIVPAVGQGVLGLGKAVTNLAPFNTDKTSGMFDKGIEYLQELKTPETQLAEQKVQEAEGFVDTLGAHIQYPSSIYTGFGQSVPGMIGGAGVARALISKGVPAITAAAMGEGSVGAVLSAQGIRDSQGGEDLSLGQGAIAALSGVGTGGLGVLGAKVAQKLGVADVDVLLASKKSGVEVPTEVKSRAAAALKGAISESVFEELPQSVQEQIAQNLATDRPWDEGVGEAAASGLAIATVPGAGAGFYGQTKANAAIRAAEAKKAAETEKADAGQTTEAGTEETALPESEESPTNTVYEDKLNAILSEVEPDGEVGDGGAGVSDGGAEGEGGVDSDAVGASTEIPGQPGGQPDATGVDGVDGSRVVGVEGSPVTTEEGTESQPNTLEVPVDATPELAAEINKYNQQQIAAAKPVEAPVEAPVVEEVPTAEATVVDQVEAPVVDQVEAPVVDQVEAPTIPTLTEEEKARGIALESKLEAEQVQRLEENYQVKTTEAAGEGQVDKDTISAYNEEVKNQPDSEKKLPVWQGNLNQAEKALFTAVNKTQGIDEAIKALRDFRFSPETGTVSPPKNKNAALYELNRSAAAKEHKIEMPKWQELSTEERESFLSGLPKLTRKKTTYTGAELHQAFGSVANELEKAGKGIRGASQVDIESAKLKGSEQEAKARAQTESEVERAKAAEAVGKGETVSETAKEALEKEGINGVLDFIASQGKGLKLDFLDTTGKKIKGLPESFNILQAQHKKATQTVFKKLASVLNTVNFTSQVVTDVNDAAIQRLQQEGKLAEYDPATDTFYFTPEGLDESTILHEAVHAATVKLINQGQTNPETLTSTQKEAVEHLNKLYEFVSRRLGSKFPNAVENVYEFVAYAMTDLTFQEALSNLQVPRLAKYTTKDPILGPLLKSAWGQFTQVLSNMYGLIKVGPTAYKVYDEIYGPLAKEFASTKESIEELYVETEDGDRAFETKFEYEGPKKSEKFASGNRLISIGKGYEGNVLLEVSEIMSDLLSAPEEGIDVKPLAAKVKLPEEPNLSPDKTFDSEVERLNKRTNDQLNGTSIAAKFKAVMTDKVGSYRKAVKLFENIAEPLKRWQNRLESADKIIYDESKDYNNVYDKQVAAAATASVLYGDKVQALENTLSTQLTDLTKKFKTDAVTMLNKLQMFVTALHEPERRRIVFMRKVPLSDTVMHDINGRKDTPNNWRNYIFSALENLKDKPGYTAEQQAKKLRKLLDEIIFTDTGNLDAENANERKGILNKKNMGVSTDPNVFDENSDQYIVEAGYSPDKISDFRSVLNNSPFKEDVVETLKTVNRIEEATKELNKMGSYWSPPVANLVSFYGFKHYVPFKGNPKRAEESNTTFYETGKDQTSRDLQYYLPSFEGGRVDSADNPIIQVLTDANKAAFLAANKKVTQAVANAVKQGLIKTVNGKRAPTKIILFADRYEGLTQEEIKDKNTVFNYKEDGSIEVYAIADQGLLESLRQPYKLWGDKTKAAFRGMGAVTRGIGQGFTRFNPFFAPWNAVRDTLTNLYNINVDYGLTVSGKYISNTVWNAMVNTLVGGGMITSARVTRMYNKGDMEGIRRLAKKDKFAKDFLEYAESGGVVTYLRGVSTVRELRDMNKLISRGSTAITFDKLKDIAAYPFDMWFNGFENTARVSAFAAIKDGLLAKGLNQQEAKEKAAIVTKELANFEHTGKYGSEMGALYMFARAQATGAVRSIDSLSYIAIPAEKAALELPKEVQEDPEAMAAFMEDYNRKRIYSSITAAALFGLGYMVYMMALAGSDDDELDENIVEKDDMARWTRAMRFTIPGTDYMFQLPWGFGKGSFMAWGAQIAAYNAGTQTLSDMLGNSITIGMDSYIPLPVSRIPVTKDIRTTAYSITDTVAPTVLRPVFEWLINTNGLGMTIQNLEGSRGNKTPDSFAGRINVPQYYKDATMYLFEITDGKLDITPDVLYFFASSYLNGISMLGQNLENGALLASGDKEFAAKTDTVVLNSFVGTRSDYYTREFMRVEEEIIKKRKRLEGFTTLQQRLEYLSRHPDDEGLIMEYQRDVLGDLKALRSQRNNIIQDRSLSNKVRTDLLKENKLNQQILKRLFIAKYKYFDESLKSEIDKD